MEKQKEIRKDKGMRDFFNAEKTKSFNANNLTAIAYQDFLKTLIF